MAAEGFRTLAVAQRDLTESEYQQWSQDFHLASVSVNNREEKLSRMAEIIEKDLTLLGATAVEDKLQVVVANIERGDDLTFCRMESLMQSTVCQMQESKYGCLLEISSKQLLASVFLVLCSILKWIWSISRKQIFRNKEATKYVLR